MHIVYMLFCDNGDLNNYVQTLKDKYLNIDHWTVSHNVR